MILKKKHVGIENDEHWPLIYSYIFKKILLIFAGYQY